MAFRRSLPTVGTTFSDNAEAYYDLLSAGLGVKDGTVQIATTLQLMTDAANLAVGGIGSMKDSLDFMTTALNAFRGPLTTEFGDPLLASTKIADAFAKSVELGKVTVAELGPVFSTAAPLAAQLGVDFREMAAIVAVMTQQGFDAGEAFTALRSALVGVQRDSKKLQDAALKDTKVLATMQKYGVKTWLELIDVAGFQTFASTLREYSERTGTPLIKLLGRIEGVQAILGTTGSQAENYAYALDQVTNSSGNAAEQAILFNDSLSAQLNLFKNALFAIGDALFRRAIIDPLKDFVRQLNYMALAILDVIKANQKLIDVIIPIFTLVTGLTALTKGASAIQNIFLRLGGPISGFAIGIGRIGAAIALIAGPLVGAVVAFTTLQKLIEYGVLPAKTFGRVIADINVAMNNIGRAFGAAVGAVKQFFAIVFGDDSAGKNRPAAKGIEDRLDAMFAGFGKVITSSLEIAGAAIGLAVDDLIDSVQKFFGEGFDARAQAIGRSVLKALEASWEWLAPRAASALGQALTFGAEVLTNLVEFGAGVASALGQAIINALPKVAEFINGIPDALGSTMQEGGLLNTIFTQFEEWGRSFVGWFQDNGPAIAKGIGDVFRAIGRTLGIIVPQALGKVSDFLGSVFDNIVANKDEIIEKAGGIVTGVLNALKWLAEKIVPPLADAAGKLIDWIAVDAIPFVFGAVARFIDEVVKSIVPLGEDGGRLEKGLTDAGGQLISWITDRIPGALEALLNYIIEIENWIITVLAPRIAAVLVGIGAMLVKGLIDGIIWVLNHPGDAIAATAKAVYAFLAASLIVGMALKAGAIVSLAYSGAIAAVKFGAGLLRTAGLAVATFLGRAVTAGTVSAMGGAAASVTATVATALTAALAAVVVVAAVAIKIRSDIAEQGSALRDQVKTFVQGATVKGLRDAQAAIESASNKLDLFLDFGIITGQARADLAALKAEIDAKLVALGEQIDPRPLPVRVYYEPTLATGGDLPSKVDEMQAGAQAYMDKHPPLQILGAANMLLRIETLKVDPDVLAENAKALAEFKDPFNLDPTVQKFKDGLDDLVDTWNAFPDRLTSIQEQLAKDLETDPKDFMKDTVTSFQTGYAQIKEAMDSGNPIAIVRAQQLAAEMTKMAEQTNDAFIAAGKSPPFLIDPLTGAVTLAGQASKDLAGAVITPVSAIPTEFWTAGNGAGQLADGINAHIPEAIAAAEGIRDAVLPPVEPLPTDFYNIGQGTANKFNEGLQTGNDPIGTTAGEWKYELVNPLKPLPGIFSGLGTDTAANYNAGLQTGTDPIGTTADKWKYELVTPIKPLPGIFSGLGKGTGSSFVGGVRSKITPAGAAGSALRDAVLYPLKPTDQRKAQVSGWGASVAWAWVTGLSAKLRSKATKLAIQRGILTAMKAMEGASPPKEGPLTQIDVWGANIASAWIDGIVEGLKTGPQRVADAMKAVGESMNSSLGTATVPLAFATQPYAGTATPSFTSPQSSAQASGTGSKTTFGDIIVSVDAKGVQQPERVGQLVGDAMAQVLREQTARATARR